MAQIECKFVGIPQGLSPFVPAEGLGRDHRSCGVTTGILRSAYQRPYDRGLETSSGCRERFYYRLVA